jgi:hypothetical protein
MIRLDGAGRPDSGSNDPDSPRLRGNQMATSMATFLGNSQETPRDHDEMTAEEVAAVVLLIKGGWIDAAAVGGVS